MKIITVVGARPQFVKASMISLEFHNRNVEECIVHTGQHYDKNMSDLFFEEMNIPRPKYNLHIGGGTHGENTGRMIEGIEKILEKENPDVVLVYGDTDSTLAAALSSSKMHIPVAHVEAGLRSYNKKMPEEINRVLTDHVSDVLYAPTVSSINNLEVEGLKGESVKLVGDVMYDAALYFGGSECQAESLLEKLNVTSGDYFLATVHRPSNTDDKDILTKLFSSFRCLEATILLPIHPRTKACLQKHEISVPNNVRVLAPLSYLDMISLTKHAKLVLTDSGGLQKEAYFCGVPCLTLRGETEWGDTVDSGWNILVNDYSVENLLDCSKRVSFQEKSHSNAFGAGNTRALVVDDLIKRYA